MKNLIARKNGCFVVVLKRIVIEDYGEI